jgi:hypothetical protein
VQTIERFVAGYEKGRYVYEEYENYKVSVLLHISKYISGDTKAS